MEVVTLTNLPRPWNDPVLTEDAAYHLLTRPHHVLFAVGDAGAGGHLLAGMVPGAPADIITLYVPPEQRRNGHAKALLENMILTARHLGCTGLTLEVAASNTAAINLYTVCGLQQVAKRAAYYTNPVSNLKEDALVMAVSLA